LASEKTSFFQIPFFLILCSQVCPPALAHFLAGGGGGGGGVILFGAPPGGAAGVGLLSLDEPHPAVSTDKTTTDRRVDIERMKSSLL
jgi:hypothetical protein